MNKQMFVDKISAIELPKLMIESALTEDDIGTVLRIHFLSEQLADAWICAACNAENFFGEGNFSVRINCSDKFKLARNLGLPDPIYSCLKIINKIRNNIAHGNGEIAIPTDAIEKMVGLLKSFRVGNDTDNLSIEAPVGITNIEKSSKVIYSITDPDTPNRVKLFICFSFLVPKLSFSIWSVGNDIS
ncbi:hypothetical protein ABN327_20030 [Providencia huaxiensis]|uniref:hypothetical protein n=1 Tax=Providencia huaxiensis TaxID=2027290 RepID=UPI0032DAD9E0